MRRLGTLTLAVTTLLLLGEVLWAGDARPQQKSLKDQLVGSWMVSGWEQVGPGLKRFDGDLKGVNVFDAHGQFFVMFARSRLLRIASNDPALATSEEAKDLAALIAYTPGTPDEAKVLEGGVIAYYGTYLVNEADKTVILHVEASSFPNQVGVEQIRTITSLRGDELTYQNPVLSGGQNLVTIKRMFE
jgi:lipocalin-like protein